MPGSHLWARHPRCTAVLLELAGLPHSPQQSPTQQCRHCTAEDICEGRAPLYSLMLRVQVTPCLRTTSSSAPLGAASLKASVRAELSSPSEWTLSGSSSASLSVSVRSAAAAPRRVLRPAALTLAGRSSMPVCSSWRLVWRHCCLCRRTGRASACRSRGWGRP